MSSSDTSGSFYSMHKLCCELEKESSHSGKTQLIKSFCNIFKGDLYLLAKLMLCKEDKRIFRIKDKAMLKICAHIWDSDLDEMIEDLDNGDFTETCKKFYIQYGQYPEKSTLTLKEVDETLDSLTLSGKFDDQVKIIRKLLKRCTPFDFRLFCRIVDSDLKVNTGAKFFLDALHKDAYDAFKKANNLKGVIEKIIQHDFDNKNGKKSSSSNDDDDDDDNEDNSDSESSSSASKKKKTGGKSSSSSSSFEVGVKLMTPIKPMLPKAVKSVDGVAQSSKSFYAEIKYDGERIQIHKDGNQFSCFSRNLKPLLPWKVDEVKAFIPKATKAQQMILDGEILLMDTKTGVPLPFGTLSIHKKNGFADAKVCVFLFDILYLNGKSLIHLPLQERRDILVKNVDVIKNRIEFSEVTIVNGVQEKSKLTALLNRAFREKLEGLVIKDSMSEYEPGCRHWIKIKKDYLQGMADSADLIVVGGYYGSGSSGGLVTVFLMVCYDKVAKNYKTVVKASGGFDDNTIAKLQPKILSSMTKISKDVSKVPTWLEVHKQYAPDFIVKDIKEAMVFEIESAEFTKSDHHTAGYSMRFPRILKIRKDKDYKTATTLQELMEIGQDIKIIPYGKSDSSKTTTTTTTTSTTSSSTTSKSIKKQKLSDDDDEEDSSKLFKNIEDQDDEIDKNNISNKNNDKQQQQVKTPNLYYVQGDVTEPFSESTGDESKKTFVLNYVDNSGVWNEKGLSGVIGKKWPSIPKEFGDTIIKSGEIRTEKVKDDQSSSSSSSSSNGKKIYICNLSCIIPPKSKKESYSFSLKEFKSAIKEAKGAINQQKASIHLVKPQFSSPSWSDLQEIIINELCQNGIKVFVHSIKTSSPTTNSPITTSSPKTTTTTTTTTLSATVSSSSTKTTTTSSGGSGKISPLKRAREEDQDDNDENNKTIDNDQLEHDLIKDLEPMEPVFQDVNAVIDSSISDSDRKRLEKAIRIMGGYVSKKWQPFGTSKTTHLICNSMSDLYLHVDRLGGSIVLPLWIDQCFGSNKLLPLCEDYIYFNKENHPDYSLSMEEQSSSSSSTSSSNTTTSSKKQEHLLNIFKDCNIFLHENVNDKETLKRYIIAFGGDISGEIDNNTTHLIASLPPNFSTIKSKDLFKSLIKNNSNNNNQKIVNSLWLWDSINMRNVLDVKSYFIK